MPNGASQTLSENYSASRSDWKSETSHRVELSRRQTVRPEPGVVNFGISGLTTVLAIGLTSIASSTLPTANTSLVAEVFTPALRARPRSGAALLEAELDGYKQLHDGWDGVGSIKPHPTAIRTASQFLRALPIELPLPEATVSADGSVGWFWQNQNGYVSVNFPGDGRFIYYGRTAGQVARGASAFDGRVIPQDLIDVVSQI